MAVAAALSFSLLSASSAIAMTVGTASGVQQGLAETNAVEKVVRVCRHRFFTSKRECYVDRSRPPTVCHRIRGTNRMDCY
jgi:thermostable 8-oxoguanine DNA glycosylase